VKVLVSDTLPQEGLRVLEENDIELIYRPKLPPDELKTIIRDCDGLIVRSGTKVTADVIASAERLKAICRAGVGVDNIDVPAASKKGIIVMNTPGGNIASTAEHTIAMLLALSRNIPQANASLRGGEWDRKRFIGSQIAGKVLGVIGLGRVGCGVAKRAIGLEMRVVGYDPFIPKAKAEEIGVDLKQELDELLKISDYITVHTPLTDETRGLIGKREFELMKNGVRIINCARGGIIDEEALYEAIVSGKVAGAALDVFSEEPPKDRKLVEHERVIATPHLGASTEEAQMLVAIEAAEQMRDALFDRGIRNAVNLPALDMKQVEEIQPYISLGDKMGRLMMQLAGGRVKRLEIGYFGEIAAKDTSLVTRGVLAGLLAPILDEQVNIVNAPLLAEERKISINERKSDEAEDFVTLIEARIETDKGSRSVAGTVFGKGDARIVRIDGYSVEVLPEGYVLVLFDIDRPGLIGNIGRILGSHNINIARMTFGRKKAGGDAITALNVDSPVPAAVLKEIESIENVHSAHLVSL